MTPGTRYWMAERESRPMGAIGLELGVSCVLLRSAIVDLKERGQGIGQRLTSRALEWAAEHGYGVAYCFSTEAGRYWIARGFAPCPVSEVVAALPDAPQVRLFEELGWLPTEDAFRLKLQPLRLK